MVTRAHPWKLVAPWYRWAHAALPEDGRTSAPVLQKFSGDDFIERFLADPQHSLLFDSQVDVVSRLDAAGFAVTGKRRVPSNLAQIVFPMATLPPPLEILGDPAARLAKVRAAPSDLRKLFLPAHDRHYLVVCELHCDMPGFPSVAREEACEAGFVIRRRQTDIPASLRSRAKADTAAVSALESELADLELLAQEAPARALRRGDEGWQYAEQQQRNRRRAALAATAASWDAYLASRRAALALARANLRQWFAQEGVLFGVEAWRPGDAGTPPRWTALAAERELSDTTHELHEQFFPLTPLVPDPRITTHDATGRTIYFGLVPTVMADHDPDGNARFDDASTYEIRCFVRRHDATRLRPQGDPDCCGEVVWSEASAPYRLAPPFDVVGTSQRPITIQMPDLGELNAQIAARPRGKLSPVKFVKPQHLSPNMVAMLPVPTPPGGPAVCFESIPLITITALFLLNIFMPIVTYIFSLWSLLALRFCIMPQLPPNPLDAALAAVPPGVDLAQNNAVSVGGVPQSASALRDQMAARLEEGIRKDTHREGDTDHKPTADDLKSTDLAGLAVAYADNAALPDDPADAPPGLGYREETQYEPHRDPQWKLAAGGRG
jgi:hypothetical protein